ASPLPHALVLREQPAERLAAEHFDARQHGLGLYATLGEVFREGRDARAALEQLGDLVFDGGWVELRPGADAEAGGALSADGGVPPRAGPGARRGRGRGAAVGG